jgi:hypothetical protein
MLKLSRNGAVGFIDWLDVILEKAPDIPLEFAYRRPSDRLPLRVIRENCRQGRVVVRAVIESFLHYKNLGAYRVRYLFVICGFSIAETQNLGSRFLLGRAPEARGSEPF